MGSTQGLGQGREFRIRRLLKPIHDYDVMIIDTSPVQTPLNVAILYAVGEVLIPIDPCVAALAGVRALEDLVQTRQRLPRGVHRRRSAGDHRGLDHTDRPDPGLEADRGRGPQLFRAAGLRQVVPSSVKFREAYARGIPLVRYDRFSPGAEAYRAAARAFLERRPGGPVRTMDHRRGVA